MKIHWLMLILLFVLDNLQAQFYHHDFLGAGHDREVVVSSSPSSGNTTQSTIDGFKIQNEGQLKEAYRFLA